MEASGRKNRRKKEGRTRTLNDASLWPFGSLMVARHASLCVPSAPSLRPPFLPISLYSSIYPPSRATPLGCTLRTPLKSPPPAGRAACQSDAKGGYTRVEISVKARRRQGCLGYLLAEASHGIVPSLLQLFGNASGIPVSTFAKISMADARMLRLTPLIYAHLLSPLRRLNFESGGFETGLDQV